MSTKNTTKTTARLEQAIAMSKALEAVLKELSDIHTTGNTEDAYGLVADRVTPALEVELRSIQDALINKSHDRHIATEGAAWRFI